MFGFKKQHGVPIAVFDISSSSVGGAHAIVKTEKSEISTILASCRVEAPLLEDLDMKRFVSNTIKNIEDVASKLHKADIHKPKSIELVLASPWYVSQTRTISYKNDTPFLFSKKLFNSLIDNEIDSIVKNDLSKFGAFGKEGSVVEKQISLIKLNGYVTGNPFNKKARLVEIYLTVTVVPKKIIDQFTDTLYKSYGVQNISITTSPYATFVLARDYLNTPNEAVIIDVGEEVTDVAFVKDGLFLYQHSFPVGTYQLYRSLMSKESHTPAEAKSIIEGYRLGKVSVATKNKIGRAVLDFSAQWQSALQGILNNGYFGFCIPEICYITADPRFEGVLPNIISSDPFIQHTCSRGKVIPYFVNEERLSGFVRSLDEGLDTSLATAVLFVARRL